MKPKLESSEVRSYSHILKDLNSYKNDIKVDQSNNYNDSS
jgi:hypothetical protein